MQKRPWVGPAPAASLLPRRLCSGLQAVALGAVLPQVGPPTGFRAVATTPPPPPERLRP